MKGLKIEISKNESKLKQEQETYNKWVQEEEAKIYQIQNKAEELKRSFNGININQLNFNVDYETLQLSNPWFDIINLVIPVISSTFASFSRMCANMGVKTIGHIRKCIYSNTCR